MMFILHDPYPYHGIEYYHITVLGSFTLLINTFYGTCMLQYSIVKHSLHMYICKNIHIFMLRMWNISLELTFITDTETI